MTTDTKRLRELLAKATPGPWEVYPQAIENDEQAKEELCFQVDSTEPVGDYLYLINAGGKCPALTGCGPKSAENAALLAAAVNALPDLLSHIDALETRVAEAESKTSGILEVKLVDQNGMEVDSKGRFYRDLLKEEAWRDENGAIWTRPTARAYARVYQARDNHQQRAEAAERQRDEAVKVLRDVARTARGMLVENEAVLTITLEKLVQGIRDQALATISKITGEEPR